MCLSLVDVSEWIYAIIVVFWIVCWTLKCSSQYTRVGSYNSHRICFGVFYSWAKAPYHTPYRQLLIEPHSWESPSLTHHEINHHKQWKIVILRFKPCNHFSIGTIGFSSWFIKEEVYTDDGQKLGVHCTLAVLFYPETFRLKRCQHFMDDTSLLYSYPIHNDIFSCDKGCFCAA